MNKYLYSFFLLFLFSCGENNGPSNEELLAEASKSAPWSGEATVEITTDNDRKSVIIFIDSLLLDLGKPNIFFKDKIVKSNFKESSTSNDFNLTYTSSLGGFINWKGQTVINSFTDETFTDSSSTIYDTNSTYTFNAFIDLNYSINGTLKLKKTRVMNGPGHSSLDSVIDGGVSYKNNDGIHNVAIHIEFHNDDKLQQTVLTTTFSAIVNGVEIKGDLIAE